MTINSQNETLNLKPSEMQQFNYNGLFCLTNWTNRFTKYITDPGLAHEQAREQQQQQHYIKHIYWICLLYFHPQVQTGGRFAIKSKYHR